MDKRGIPSLALCTEAFAGALGPIAAINGRRDKNWAQISHPFGSLDDAAVRERAERFVAEFYKEVLIDG